MENIWIWISVYVLIMNLVGVAIMGSDKKKAIRHQYRVPEKRLFLISLLGGSIGTWAGMYIFRHKTRHWYFVVFMPLILAVQIVLIIYFA